MLCSNNFMYCICQYHILKPNMSTSRSLIHEDDSCLAYDSSPWWTGYLSASPAGVAASQSIVRVHRWMRTTHRALEGARRSYEEENSFQQTSWCQCLVLKTNLGLIWEQDSILKHPPVPRRVNPPAPGHVPKVISQAHKGVACVMNTHTRCVPASALLDAGMARYAGWRRRVAVAFHLISVLSFVS